jgi:hypothetical protein
MLRNRALLIEPFIRKCPACVNCHGTWSESGEAGLFKHALFRRQCDNNYA